jgi:CRP-like cAMP-binding protein
VEFLEGLSAQDSQLLLAASSALSLAEGQSLRVRGEAGGDLFVIEAGVLEVLDLRQRPHVVREVLGAGRIVGALGFVDGGSSPADVRARGPVQLRRWKRADLQACLEQHPRLGLSFYRALSDELANMVRQPTLKARPRAPRWGGSVVSLEVAERAAALAAPSRQAWTDAEDRLRDSPSDPEGKAAALRGLSILVESASSWIGSMSDQAKAQAAGNALLKEVQPFLGRARLVNLAQEAGLGANSAEFMAHILLNEGGGDGALGQAIDRGLLALPTAVGLRARQRPAVMQALAGLPSERPVNITLIQPSCGALLAKLVRRLSGLGGTVTVIDGDPETLAVVDLGMHQRPAGVQLRLVSEDLSSLSQGQSTLPLPAQDVIVVHGLLEHLPDRMVSTLAAWAAENTTPGGRVVFTSMGPAADHSLVDHLLGWPMIRRTEAELIDVLSGGGLLAQGVPIEDSQAQPGLVLVAST